MKVFCLLGPTASGKTELALSLAEDFPLEIVSVDSALVYRGMNIGSAKPSPAILECYPHHLIDIREPSEPYSAADFAEDASSIIEEICARGKLPFLVGGTPLYFQALEQGLSTMPKAQPEIRQNLQNILAQKGLAVLYERLAKVDPHSAQKISMNDPQRILRALEIYEATGQTLSSFWEQAPKTAPPYKFVNLGILPLDRAALHARIAERFDRMLAQGFLEEVKSLMARPDFDAHLPAFKSVGYRQAIEHLQGLTDFASFRERGLAATRQLAKRQMTWLRHWPGLVVFEEAGGALRYLQNVLNKL